MNDKEKYSFLLEEIKAQQVKVDEETIVLKVLEHLLSKYSPSKDSINSEENTKPLPTEFSNDLTIPDKLYVALYKIKNGTVHDIVNSLLKLDTTYPPLKALKDARNNLSKLFRNGTISAKKGKKGRGYIYSIK